MVELPGEQALESYIIGLSFVGFAWFAGNDEWHVIAGRWCMPKALITLDEQQVARLEQVIIDHDEKGAWELLAELRAKVRATQQTRCGIEKLRKDS